MPSGPHAAATAVPRSWNHRSSASGGLASATDLPTKPDAARGFL
jgi:hypothetical protein